MHGTTKEAHTKLVKEYLMFHTNIEYGFHELSDVYNHTRTPAKFVKHRVDTGYHVMLWQQCDMTILYCNFLANCSGGKVW
jgi:hypothetical protein